MTKHWALIIGINNYQHLQPLLYAQRDAQSLRDFLVQAGGFVRDRCLLLTDISPAFEEHSSLPNRETIQAQLNQLCQSYLQAGDVLWVFFSGYGTQLEGQDYLMPLEGDPNRIPETALAMRDLFEQLSQAPTNQLLVLLDINRSQGSLAGQQIGLQTLDLAREFEIPVLLSCQPDQFSHETIALRSGLFTHAILEGLYHHGCATPVQLADYISDRLPELSQHHWRPTQEPIAVIPPSHKHLLLLPTAVAIPVGAAVGASQSAAAGLVERPDYASNGMVPAGVTAGTGRTEEPGSPLPDRDPAASDDSQAVSKENLTEVSRAADQDDFWSKLVALGLLAVVLLLGGVLWRNPFLNPFQQPEESETPSGDRPVTDGVLPSDSSQPDGSLSEVPQPPSDPATGEPSVAVAPSPEPSPEPVAPGATPPNTDAQAQNQSGPRFPLAGLFRPGANADSEATSGAQNRPLAQAQAALDAGRYQEAQDWLNRVPANQRNRPEYQALQQSLQERAQATAERNRILLEDAKAPIRPTQASDFNRAIAAARQIRPGEPLYAEAQQNIDRWSRVILDLAEGRAAQGDLDPAIAAARLVPPDQPEVYRQAQQRITLWEQRKANQAIIADASRLLQPGQAHTFRDGILRIRQIPPGQPGYETARLLADQWSREMMSIARARAAQGRFDFAIRAAEMVPADTAAYPQAQQELQRWRNR